MFNPDGSSMVLRFSRSQRVKEREVPENVETRLVMSAVFLGHALQSDQMVATLVLGLTDFRNRL